MSKKLAIKGHSTRGKEVVELLEMMGGYADNLIDNGTDEKYAYFILKDENNAIDAFPIDKKDEFDFDTQIFTLEEFLKKYPYKIGDKVYTKSNSEGTIIDMSWYENEILYQLSSQSVNALGYFRVNELKSYKEEVNIEDKKLFGTLSNPVETKSHAVILKDGKVIDNSIDASQFMQMKKICGIIFNEANYEDEVELQLGDYEIEVRDGRTYAVRKKPKYPKTYEECCKNYPDNEKLKIGNLLCDLEQLIICRNVYWKIAGEQMGLDKPWEPNWRDETTKYGIGISRNFVFKDDVIYTRRILVFPTKEIRDAFYENFKELIEVCKELL